MLPTLVSLFALAAQDVDVLVLADAETPRAERIAEWAGGHARAVELVQRECAPPEDGYVTLVDWPGDGGPPPLGWRGLTIFERAQLTGDGVVFLGRAGARLAGEWGLFGGRAEPTKLEELVVGGATVRVSDAPVEAWATEEVWIDSPATEVLARSADGRAVVWRQSRHVRFGLAAGPDELTPAGRALLADALRLAAKHGREWGSQVARGSLDEPLREPPFALAETVDELASADVAVRARAREALGRYVSDGPGRWASHAEWSGWLASSAKRARWSPGGARFVVDPKRRARRAAASRAVSAELLELELDALVELAVTGDDAPALEARRALLERGDGAVGALAAVVAGEDAHRTERACVALAPFGERGAGAVEALVGALSHEGYVVRIRARQALSRVGMPALDALAGAAGDDALGAEARAGALEAIEHLRDPGAAVPARLLILRERLSPPLFGPWLAALARTSGGHPAAVESARLALGSGDTAQVNAALDLFGRYGAPLEPNGVREELVALLDTRPAGVELEAVVDALADCDVGLESLLERTLDTEPLQRDAAAAVLVRAGRAARPALSRWLTGERTDRRLAALEVVAAGAHPRLDAELLACLESADVRVRHLATVACARQEGAAREGLVRALGDPEPAIRRAAAYGLADPYVDPRPAADALLACLADDDEDVRVFAAMALSAAGEDAELAARLPAGDASPRVSTWLEWARFRLAPPLAWRIEAAARMDLERETERLPVDYVAELGDRDGRRRHRAARELARNGWRPFHDRLVADPEDTRAEEVLRRIDHELAAWTAEMVLLMDDEFGPGPGTNGLAALGRGALPALFEFYLEPYRFPIGPPTYEEMFVAVERIGRPALPVVVAGLWHWRDHGRADAARVIATWGERADAAWPAWRASWQMEEHAWLRGDARADGMARLAAVRAGGARSLDGFVRMLAGGTRWERGMASRALAEIPELAVTRADELVAALGSGYGAAPVVWLAARLRGRVGPDALPDELVAAVERALPELARADGVDALLAASELELRLVAVDLLRDRARAGAEEPLARLVELAADRSGHPALAEHAAWALARLGAAGAAALCEIVLGSAGRMDEPTALLAARALGWTGRESLAAIERARLRAEGRVERALGRAVELVRRRAN